MPDAFPVIPPGAVVALDTETKDTELMTWGPGWARRHGHIMGYSLASESFGQIYIPIRHLCGNNWRHGEESAFGWLRDQATRKDITWVAANGNYDLGWLETENIHFHEENVNDIQLMAPLLDEYRHSYSLDNLGADYIGERKDYQKMQEWAEENGLAKRAKLGGQIWRMPADVVGRYASQDAGVTLRLYEHFLPMIEEQSLQNIYALERSLAPVVRAMRRRGVRVDQSRAEMLREKWLEYEEDALFQITEITGMVTTTWDIDQQIKILKSVGVTEFPRTAKKQEEGLQQKFLEKLEKQDDDAGKVASCILRAKMYGKGVGTFLEGCFLNRLHNGRIHAEFHQLRGDRGGTVSGRFSSSNPNLQFLPGPEDDLTTEWSQLAISIRGCLLPEEGGEWMGNDWSSQEPRLAIHFAGLAELEGAAEMVAAFHENPRLDLHQKVCDLLNESIPGLGMTRKKAKIINLAQMYGQGDGSLAADLGLPYYEEQFRGKTIKKAGPEGQRLVRNYARIVPFMPNLAKLAKSAGRNRGYVTTIAGRRCRFPYVNGQHWHLHTALNRIIQGSAADMAKRAMVECHKAGLTLLVMVHDELGFSVQSRDEARLACEIMKNATPLLVPVESDPEIGLRWGETEPFDPAA